MDHGKPEQIKDPSTCCKLTLKEEEDPGRGGRGGPASAVHTEAAHIDKFQGRVLVCQSRVAGMAEQCCQETHQPAVAARRCDDKS